MADADPPYEDDYDERVAHVAVHREPEPPRTLEDWRIWEDACIQTNRRDWLPSPETLRIGFPYRGDWVESPTWVPAAEDHPFKGRAFCWRCVAEAQGFPTGNAPHKRDAICFEASGDPDAEDGQPDPGEGIPVDALTREAAERYLRQGVRSFDPAEDVVGPGVADPTRPALSGKEEFRRWWHAGASIVSGAEGNGPGPDPAAEPEDRPGYDTGTFFYDGPTA